MADHDSKTLRDHLLDLPQELYDEIYNLTFTAAPGPRYPVQMTCSLATSMRQDSLFRDVHLAPVPFQGHDSVALLHVDRASRDKFAKSYYGGPDAFFMFDDCRVCRKWLKSLNASLNATHLRYVRSVGLAVLAEEALSASRRGEVLAILRRWRDHFQRDFSVDLRFTLSKKVCFAP